MPFQKPSVFVLMLIALLELFLAFRLNQWSNANAARLLNTVDILQLRRDVSKRRDGSSYIGEPLVWFSLRDQSGQKRELLKKESLLKVIVLFSTKDCGVCLQEYLLWKKIHEGYPSDRILIMGISHDTEKESIISFVESKGIRFPVLLDFKDIVRTKMDLVNSPLRLILDENNNILNIEVPSAELDMQKNVLSRLDEYLDTAIKSHDFSSSANMN